MTQLIYADLLRMQRRPLYLVPIAIVVFFALLPIVFLVLSHWSPSYVGFVHAYSGYPKGLWALLRSSQYLMPVAVAIIAAGATGEDYSVGSLKVVLARATSRRKVLAAKCAAVFVASLTLLLSLVLMMACSGFLARVAIGEAFMEAPLAPADIARVVAFFALEAAYLSLMGVFFVTVTQSQTTGLLFAIVGPFLLRVLTFLPGGRFLPAAHLDVVEMTLMPGGRFSSAELESVLGSSLNPAYSFVLVLVACAVFFLGSLFALERRDVR